MTPASYPAPGGAMEPALAFDRQRPWRLLIVPALFDEGNRLRRLTVEVMRRLDGAGIDCLLPDLPGCGESLSPLESQTPAGWRDAMDQAARHFEASHVLAIRGGALLFPPHLNGWHYAPVKGSSLLRQMLRARIIAAREMGREETQESLMEEGLRHGLELAGYRLGVGFVDSIPSLEPLPSPYISVIDQDMLGGPGLWLRAEPGEDAAQADALAAVIAVGIRE